MSDKKRFWIIDSCDNASLWEPVKNGLIGTAIGEESISSKKDPKFRDTLRWLIKVKPVEQWPRILGVSIDKIYGRRTNASIFRDFEKAEPFNKIGMWIKQLSEKPLNLSLTLHDKYMLQFLTPKKTVKPGEWTYLEFDLGEIKSAKEMDRIEPTSRFTHTIRRLTLIVEGLESKKEYEVQIGEIVGIILPIDEVQLIEIKAPKKVKAGGILKVELKISPTRRFDVDYKECFIKLNMKGSTFIEKRIELESSSLIWKTGETISIGPVELKIPRFISGGMYDLVFEMGNVRIVNSKENKLTTIEIIPRTPSKVAAKISKHKGVPTLFINGKPHPGMVYMTYAPRSRHFKEFAEAGVHIMSFSTTTDYVPTWNLGGVWLSPEEFDYTDHDRLIQMVLEADPEAFLLLRVHITAPPWWGKLHPKDIVVTDEQGSLKPVYWLNTPLISWSSEAWLKDAEFALRKYLRHIKESPYRDRIIGIMVASNTGGEWLYPASCGDFSEANLSAFRKWLRKKYNNDVDALRKAWSDSKVNFNTASIPTFSERRETKCLTFRDPRVEKKVIDYYEFHSDSVANAIIRLSRIVKEEMKDVIVGVFYGYLLQLAGEPRQQEAGHLGLKRVLECPYIDFFSSPTLYSHRRLGTGYSTFMSLTESIKLHGKTWFDENDIRTHRVKMPSAKEEILSYIFEESLSGMWPPNLRDALAMQRREFANVLCHGVCMWWFDMEGGWYSEKPMMNEISHMNKIAEKAVKFNRSSVAEVAVLLDHRSLLYLETGNFLSASLILNQLPQLGRIGAPVDYYLLDDLPAIPPHKLWIFLNAFAPSDKQREIIERKVKKDGNVCVWIYAPGFIKDEGLSPDGMRELTGINIKYKKKSVPLVVSITQPGHPLTDGICGTSYGTIGTIAYEQNKIYLHRVSELFPTRDKQTFWERLSVGPVFYVEDPEAEVLGMLPAIGMPGLVMKRFDEWTSIFSSAPLLPAGLLRNLLRYSGGHIYVDSNDVVYANKSFLAISTSKGGDKIVRLPFKTSVYDVFKEETVATNTDRFEVNLPGKDTVLYFLGSEREWKEA